MHWPATRSENSIWFRTGPEPAVTVAPCLDWLGAPAGGRRGVAWESRLWRCPRNRVNSRAQEAWLPDSIKTDCTGRGLCGSGQDHSIRADALCVGGGIRWTIISSCVRPWAPGPGDNRWLDGPWSGPRCGVSCRSRSWT